MKLLLTGATGFLGRRVLATLLGDERITSITVTSRRSLTHPSPKVRMVRLDLTDIEAVEALSWDIDAVIHLAGLYDFSADFQTNYLNNVVATLNIAARLEELNRERRVPMLFASTYAVAHSSDRALEEVPLERLAPREMAYSFTKGVAERAVTDAKIPSVIFRLGVLVGSEEDGSIERIDGPYHLMKVLSKLRQLPGASLVKTIPIPANPDGVLPFVPVNVAAGVVVSALFNPTLSEGQGARIFGAYDLESVRISDFCHSAVRRLMPGAEPHFVRAIPDSLQKLYSRIDRAAAETFLYSSEPIELRNSHFRKVFPEIRIPAFTSYEDRFFAGFDAFMNGVVA